MKTPGPARLKFLPDSYQGAIRTIPNCPAVHPGQVFKGDRTPKQASPAVRGWAVTTPCEPYGTQTTLYVQLGSAALDERLLGPLSCNRCLWSKQPRFRSAALGPAIPRRRTSVRNGAARPHLFATRSQAHTSDVWESPDCRTVGTNRQHGHNCAAH